MQHLKFRLSGPRRPLFRRIQQFIALLLVAALAACTTGSPEYWLPPSAPPTAVPLAAGPAIELPVAQPSPTITSEPAALPLEAAATVDTSPLPENLPAAPATATATLPPLVPTMAVPPTLPAPAGPSLPTATPEIYVVNSAPILYYAQAADTLPVVAVRFGVRVDEISSPDPIPERSFINPGQLLIIPRRLANTTSSQHLLPDSEVVYSPSAVGFDAREFASLSGGYLNSFDEWHKSTSTQSGASIIMRVATENSVNPRLLLALLEYHSHWVYGQPETQDQKDYPLGYNVPAHKGLYNQLIWAVNQLQTGYYAYREGRLTEIKFRDGLTTRLAPDLNAGTAALQYYFAQMYDSRQWLQAVDPQAGLPALHTLMFGNPWERAQRVEPLFPSGITQPQLILPFTKGWTWSYTGGPHGAWEQEGSLAALDFAPGATEAGCTDSKAYATAAAAGLVVRTGPGLVVIDLDGDGHEQTGWVLVNLHVAEKERVAVGTWLAAGDMIGKPSCEGGFATGTHLHIARKFNGEWVPADGPLPFNLGGWIAQRGVAPYKGTLTRDGVTLVACTCSNYLTFITRTDTDP